MPASTSAGEPTPSPTREARLVDELGDDPPEHQARARRRRARCAIPSVAKKRSAAASVAGAVVGVAVSSASRPSGGSRWKPADGAARVQRRQRRGVAQQQLRAALQRRVLVGRAAVDDQRRHLAVGLARLGDVPARVLGRGRASSPGQRRVARDHDQAVAAAGLGRRRVLRPALGVRVPALARLAAVAAGGHHPRRQRRRAPARLAERLAVEGLRDPRSRRRSRRGPSARTGPCGSRPPAGRCGRPARAVAIRCSTSRSPSSPNGRLQRLTRKPVDVGRVDHVAAHRLAGRARDAERRLARLHRRPRPPPAASPAPG